LRRLILRDMETLTYGQFSDAYPPIMDGVAMTVKNYAYWLNKIKHSSYVITPKFPGYSDMEEFPVLRYLSAPIPRREPYRMGFPELDYRINHSLKEIPLSLVHAHSPFSAGYLALRTARQNNIPMVATFHSKYRDDFERFTQQKAILNQIMKRIIAFFESADEVWIPQRHVEETIREYGFKGKLEVIENGIDINVEGDIIEFRNTSRKMLGIPQHKKIFLYVGQLILEKNLKFLLESLRYIHTEDFAIYFIGQGYARPVLEKLAEEYGLTSKVKFIGPVYNRDELKRFYAIANLFLFPSLYDNAPLVIREAAVLHTPALLLRGSTAAEVIQDEYNGFLTENDPLLYAQRINQIINNDELLLKAGDMASSTLDRPWKEIVEEVKDRYSHLIKRKMN
jgi:1,2-diacylglycerol 3-alpha-glucosyltransferase